MEKAIPGRGHWPFGYPVALIGGPIRKEQKGVHGVCGADGVATTFSTPEENRVALLLAMGIWPFETESYNIADVEGTTSEAAAAARVRELILGYV